MAEAKTKVLIVDDIPANIVALEAALRPLKLDLLKAHSGIEAIGLILRHEDIALILMDVQMPEMDGFETAELIREEKNSEHIPIIFVTAISTEDKYVFRGYQAGAVDYLFKPVDSDVLLGKVRVFVQLHEQRIRTERAFEEVKRIENSRTLLLDNAYEGIVGLDQNFIINFANTAACTLLNYSTSELVGQSIKAIAAPNMGDSAWRETHIVQTALNHSKQHIEDWCFVEKSGREFQVEFTQVSIMENTDFVGSVVLFRDISERIATQKKLLQYAQHDALTGLANRSLFWNYLGKSIANGKRHKASFALLYIDLDRFKQVNDVMGHLAGDLLLTKTADRILSSMREEDFVARLGGDEFSVIATYVDSPETASELASRIIHSIEQAFEIYDQEVFIGASIGIALFPEHGSSIKTLTANADTAMYSAKSKGRNNFQFFKEEMQTAAENHLNLSKLLSRAIRADEIELKCRPVSKISETSTVTENTQAMAFDINPYCAEVPDISGINIMQIAESTRNTNILRENMLLKIKDLVENTLLKDHQQPSIFVNFHVSPYQMQMNYLSMDIADRLEGFMESQFFYIEISEAILIGNPVLAREEMYALAKRGFKICLSEFGGGQTDLQSLSSLPLSAIRISHDITSRQGEPEYDQTMLLISALGKILDVDVLVENLDTPQSEATSSFPEQFQQQRETTREPGIQNK